MCCLPSLRRTCPRPAAWPGSAFPPGGWKRLHPSVMAITLGTSVKVYKKKWVDHWHRWENLGASGAMHVTIREVAQSAGVSIATASRALSGGRNVSPAAVQAVVEASERLGYRANTVARSLRTRSTATVGMVVPRISNPYFPRLVEAVER